MSLVKQREGKEHKVGAIRQYIAQKHTGGGFLAWRGGRGRERGSAGGRARARRNPTHTVCLPDAVFDTLDFFRPNMVRASYREREREREKERRMEGEKEKRRVECQLPSERTRLNLLDGLVSHE